MESNDQFENQKRNSPSFFSLSVRELLLVFAVCAMILLYFVRPSENVRSPSKSLYSIEAPIEYRYWHQRGPSGSGTGFIGTRSAWQSAEGIEVFENFVILHIDKDYDRMIQRDDLTYFDWRKVEKKKAEVPQSGHSSAGH